MGVDQFRAEHYTTAYKEYKLTYRVGFRQISNNLI